MPANLKELLEKINQEGVQKAEEKSRAIEEKARVDAERIMEDARRQAKKIVEDAKLNAEKIRTGGELAVKQASRDLLLSLKDEIKKVLNKIVGADISRAMSPDETAGILRDLIEGYVHKNGEASDIKVMLKKDDLEKTKHSVMEKLKEKIKEGIEFKPSPSINAGFYISFDKGKSYFDFTDEGLKETLCLYLNPELGNLIK